MKKEEEDFLILKKTREGRNYNQIRKEFYDLNNFQKEMKSDKKIIVNQDKDINKLNKKIEQLEKKIFSYGLENNEKSEKNVTLGDLTKIIATVSLDMVPKQEIKALCNLERKKIDCALNFLVRNKVIQELKRGGISFYGKEL